MCISRSRWTDSSCRIKSSHPRYPRKGKVPLPHTSLRRLHDVESACSRNLTASRKNRHRVSNQQRRSQSQRPGGPPNVLSLMDSFMKNQTWSLWTFREKLSSQLSRWGYTSSYDPLTTTKSFEALHDRHMRYGPRDTCKTWPQWTSQTDVGQQPAEW